MLSFWPPLKRASCQTAYSLPFARLTPMSGMISPVRTGAPVSGSVIEIVLSRSMRNGPDQLTPLSVERSTRTVAPRSLSVFG